MPFMHASTCSPFPPSGCFVLPLQQYLTVDAVQFGTLVETTRFFERQPQLHRYTASPPVVQILETAKHVHSCKRGQADGKEQLCREKKGCSGSHGCRIFALNMTEHVSNWLAFARNDTPYQLLFFGGLQWGDGSVHTDGTFG